MLSLLLRTGGRPFAYDDIEVIHTLATAGTQLFAELPNCVVSGCQLTPSGNVYDVSGGVLWLDGELRDFPGRAGVTLPALFQVGAEIKSDLRVHTLTGQNLPCAREQNAELVDYDPQNPPSRRPLLLTTNGPLMWWHRVEEKRRRIKEIQWAADIQGSDYDSNGRGIGAAWGWALADGRGGRADLRGRFIAGLDPSRPDYDAVGKTGGQEQVALTVQQMPAHNHALPKNTDTLAGAGIITTATRSGVAGAIGNTSSTTGITGGGQEHENRPPFYVLAAWQWVGFD